MTGRDSGIVNRKVAHTLGLALPPSLPMRADHVIE